MDGGRNVLADENLVLIAYVNNDGWGEHVRTCACILARDVSVRIHKTEIK